MTESGKVLGAASDCSPKPLNLTIKSTFHYQFLRRVSLQLETATELKGNLSTVKRYLSLATDVIVM